MKKNMKFPNGEKLEYVEVAKIDLNPHNRNHPTRLNIKKRGLLQTVLLRANGRRYEVVAGEGRVLDAKASHVKLIPAIIRNATDKQAVEFRFIENTNRDDFIVTELGAICKELQDQGYTLHALAELSGHKLEKTKISEAIQIYEAIQQNPAAREAIESGKIGVSDIEALMDLTGPKKATELIVQHAAGKVDIKSILQKTRDATERAMDSEQSIATVRSEPSKVYDPPAISAELPGSKLKPEQESRYLKEVRSLPPDQSKYAMPERENSDSLLIGGQVWFRIAPILRPVLRRIQIKFNGEIPVSGECEHCHKETKVTLNNTAGRIHLETLGFTIAKTNILELSESLKQAAEKLHGLLLEAPAQ